MLTGGVSQHTAMQPLRDNQAALADKIDLTDRGGGEAEGGEGGEAGRGGGRVPASRLEDEDDQLATFVINSHMKSHPMCKEDEDRPEKNDEIRAHLAENMLENEVLT